MCYTLSSLLFKVVFYLICYWLQKGASASLVKRLRSEGIAISVSDAPFALKREGKRFSLLRLFLVVFCRVRLLLQMTANRTPTHI